MTARKGDGRDHSIIPENIRRGSRFGRMMAAVRRGETLKDMKQQFSGLDESAYRVLCKIRDGTISEGNHTSVVRVKNAVDRAERHKNMIFRLFDDGLTTKQVSEKAGIALETAADWRNLWGHERGVFSTRRRA